MSLKYRVPGPCSITWPGAQDLGLTASGVVINPVDTWEPINSDKYGTTPADFILVGKAATVSMVLQETASLKTAMDSDNMPDFASITQTDFDTANMIGRVAITDYSDPPAGSGGGYGGVLTITENYGYGSDAETWVADVAIISEPDRILLSSQQEEQLSVTFIILPNENRRLFSTVPSYLSRNV